MTPTGNRPPADLTIGGRVLLVPADEPAEETVRSCAHTLEEAGHLTRTSGSLRQAQVSAPAGAFEVVVIVLGGSSWRGGAAGLIGWVPDQIPSIVVGSPEETLARALLLAGAALVPVDRRQHAALERAVAHAVRLARALQREARYDPGQKDLTRQVGCGDRMQEVLQRVDLAAPAGVPVLLVGEVGSGKQILARAMHSHPSSPRREGPFVKAPLSALAGEDPVRIHAELFGSPDGPGLVARARDGTLFLDDITQLPDTLQAAILALVEAPARAGGAEGEVRLIAGSARDLEEDVAAGRLRPEFAHRLGVLPIRIPPLRERVSDIPILADAMVERFAARAGAPIVGLSTGAVALLERYKWPGNIRELEEHVERAVRRATGPCLMPEDLAELAHRSTARAEREINVEGAVDLWLDESLPLTENARRAASAAEIVAIRNALRATGGNVTRAAKQLKVSRLHLQKRMKRYGMRES